MTKLSQNNILQRLRKYLRATASEQEISDLRDAASHDPFLADAMDGFESQTTNHQANLDRLRTKLQKKYTEDSQTGTIFSLRKIAASLLLFLIVGAGLWSLNHNLGFQNQTKSTAVIPESLVEDQNATNTTSSLEDSKTKNKEWKTNKAQTNESLPAEKAIKKSKKKEEQIASSRSGTDRSIPAAPTQEALVDEVESLEVEPEETIVSTKTAADLVNVETTVDDSEAVEEQVDIKYTVEEKLPTGVNIEDADKEATNNAKKPAPTTPTYSDENYYYSDAVIISPVPVPMIGMEAYKKYIQENLRYPSAAKINKIAGKVVVVFEVSDNGRPINLKIEKSLGYGCDEEAIRLITKGADWERVAKQKLVYYEIVFQQLNTAY